MDNSIFAATLNSISAHVAVLNEAGEIIYVNEAWKRFADNNSLRASNYGVGTSYLNVCDTDEGTSPLSGWFARLIDDAAACDACIEILTENPDFWNRENVRR